jgi:RNA polymerase sigma-70 factor (ECF subfamily)
VVCDPNVDFTVLVDGARRGDREALGDLWSRFQPLLLRYLRGRRAAEPADLASQAWLDVAAGLARFSGTERDFRRWLFTIARRRHIDAVRRSVRRPVVELRPHHDTPVTAVDTADLDRALRLIGELPAEMGEAVLLRYLGDLDIDEIAAIQGKRPGAVRVALHRGMQRLNRAMGAGR